MQQLSVFKPRPETYQPPSSECCKEIGNSSSCTTACSSTLSCHENGAIRNLGRWPAFPTWHKKTGGNSLWSPGNRQAIPLRRRTTTTDCAVVTHVHLLSCIQRSHNFPAKLFAPRENTGCPRQSSKLSPKTGIPVWSAIPCAVERGGKQCAPRIHAGTDASQPDRK